MTARPPSMRGQLEAGPRAQLLATQRGVRRGKKLRLVLDRQLGVAGQYTLYSTEASSH